MHSKSNNIEVVTYDNAKKVIKEIFELLLSKYQIELETSMRGNDSIFDGVNLLYHKCHKVNFKRGCSYIDSQDWIKNKKVTPNPKYYHDKCFQYAATVALNHKEIGGQPERVSNIKPFINKHNWQV